MVDRWNLIHPSTQLTGDGFAVVPWGQGALVAGCADQRADESPFSWVRAAWRGSCAQVDCVECYRVCRMHDRMTGNRGDQLHIRAAYQCRKRQKRQP